MHPNKIRRLSHTPWAIVPHAFDALLNAQPLAISQLPKQEPKREMFEVVDGVAVVSISGIIDHDASPLDELFGSVDVDGVRAIVAAAIDDPTITAIVLDFDSPGGIVTGVPEAAAFIAEASKEKPIVAFTDSLMCSAAYWLASGAGAILATPSAEVGSVGVYLPVLDLSGYYASQGVAVDLIKSGDLKAAGYPGTKLTDVQRADLQAGVDDIHADFVAAVKAGRAVDDKALRGQSMMGARALDAGLVDDLGELSDAVELARSLGAASNKFANR